jgi:hypothetical protein
MQGRHWSAQPGIEIGTSVSEAVVLILSYGGGPNSFLISKNRAGDITGI